MGTTGLPAGGIDDLAGLAYPNRVLRLGQGDRASVKLLQRRLNQRGCGPLAANGVFGTETRDAVRLFQARFPDVDGLPLEIDGMVGPITWTSLFGRPAAVRQPVAASPLLVRAVEKARSQVGVREQPTGSNRGPEVDEYLRTVGLDPAAGSFAWCAAFVYWCFEQAAVELGRSNPLVPTAGVLEHWRRAARAGIPEIATADAVARPDRLGPGVVFVIGTGGGFGHTGIVAGVADGKLTTIEGNTNAGGGREGIGVFERRERRIVDVNRGFIDYAGA